MRLVLCMLLTLAATPAWAEWTEVGKTDDGVFYIDLASIRSYGEFRQAWVLLHLLLIRDKARQAHPVSR